MPNNLDFLFEEPMQVAPLADSGDGAIEKDTDPGMDDEVLALVGQYRKYIKRGATPEEAYDYLLGDA